MSKKIMSKVATLLSAFAVISVKPASVLYIYKGETPKELLK
ncbi:cyclic lactone autoinducer peptide [Paenibacillus glucanolyticus]